MLVVKIDIDNFNRDLRMQERTEELPRKIEILKSPNIRRNGTIVTRTSPPSVILPLIFFLNVNVNFPGCSSNQITCNFYRNFHYIPQTGVIRNTL